MTPSVPPRSKLHWSAAMRIGLWVQSVGIRGLRAKGARRITVGATQKPRHGGALARSPTIFRGVSAYDTYFRGSRGERRVSISYAFEPASFARCGKAEGDAGSSPMSSTTLPRPALG